MLKGHIDELSAEGAIGWLWGNVFTRQPVVRAFLLHEPVGEAVADIYRPDLEQVGFGDGRCGFDIRFNRPMEPAELPFVSVRPDGFELAIPHAGGKSYIDLARSILGAYPGAGRNRSILGGLWTDRTDAAQILAGRVATGACPAEFQPALRDLILNGFVVLPGALAPAGLSARHLADAAALAQSGGADRRAKSALAEIAASLFRDPIVRLMRAVFDDHPVIYGIEAASGTGAFGQASAVDTLPSPAECMLLYVGPADAAARIDYVRGSHELGELGPGGHSRWTREGAGAVASLAAGAGLSLDSVQIEATDLAIVGPGLVHRLATDGSAGLRALAAPRRITPTRFLSGERPWVEAAHVSGARIRI